VEYDSSICQSIKAFPSIFDGLIRTFLSLLTSSEQILINIAGVDKKWDKLAYTDWIVIVIEGDIPNERN
jgi:hypothetical protein